LTALVGYSPFHSFADTVPIGSDAVRTLSFLVALKRGDLCSRWIL